MSYDNVIVFSLFLPIEKNGQRAKREGTLRKVTVCESSCKQNINNLLDKVLDKGLMNSAHCLLLVVPLLVGPTLLCDLAEFYCNFKLTIKNEKGGYFNLPIKICGSSLT